MNARVNALRKRTRSRGLAVETVSENLRVLKKCEKFDDLELKVESPKKIGPKLVIFDVDNKTTNEVFMHELYERNLKRANMSENEFRQRVKMVSGPNRKGVDVDNVVVQLTRGMHDILIMLKSECHAYINAEVHISA